MITFVIQALRSGGAEKQLLLTATMLAQNGIPCRILTLATSRSPKRVEQLIDNAAAAGVAIDRPSALAHLSGFRLLSIFGRLSLRSSGVVWTWGLRADTIGRIASVMNRRLRLVCGQRSADQGRLRQQTWAVRFLSSQVAAYVANSYHGCELLQAVLPGSRASFHVIYNTLEQCGMARPAFELPATLDRLRVLMLGNMGYRTKGYDVMLRAAARLRKVGGEVEFHIAGRQDDAKEFFRERTRLGLDDLVFYRGETNWPDDFLRSGHVFLLASRAEGMPNALLEAMDLGLPCIATRVGDVARFAKDKVHLRIVEIGDVDGIVAAVEAFRKDWPAARQMGAAARRLCQREFAPGRLLQRTKEVLAELE